MFEVSGLWWGIISLIFGVIVMIFPKILNYLIGIYLIIIGILAHYRALQRVKMPPWCQMQEIVHLGAGLTAL